MTQSQDQASTPLPSEIWSYQPIRDSDIYTNARGGKQSKLGSDLTLIPPLALLRCGEVVKKGAEAYGKNNWRRITRNEHLAHALEHIYNLLAGIEDPLEDELAHATVRLLMSMETQ
jgi:hypothetical protein